LYVVSLEADKYDNDDDDSMLVGTNWQLSDINGAPAIRDEYEGLQGLSFLSEFELNGFDGCNQFSAEWNTVPSSSMITVNLGRRTRRGCGWMTEEQDMQMRNFMEVLLRQDAIAYSLSEDEQELTLYTDDAPTMTLTRIVDDDELEEDDEGDKIGEEEEQMKDEPELTVVGAEYVSISSGPTRPNDERIVRCLHDCEGRYEQCNREGWSNCRARRDGCFDRCVTPSPW
jgi:heat shock protein HslJ